LEILGYRSIHFPIIMQNTSIEARLKYRLNKWAKELGAKQPVFENFTAGTGKTLSFRKPKDTDFDALTDIPAARFYRELDEAFPDSKFILTVRDETAWLSSCSRFFAKGTHQFFKWRQINLDMYGVESYSQTAFQDAYARHISAVQSYFNSRPNDLLVMNIPAGDGWEKLCPFLDKPVPEQPFPKNHVTSA
jgi:hypothetical protein